MPDESPDTRKPDGGPAFPSRNYSDGMSLRDYFAGQALAGYLPLYTNSNVAEQRDGIAGVCYVLADAMLAAREGK